MFFKLIGHIIIHSNNPIKVGGVMDWVYPIVKKPLKLFPNIEFDKPELLIVILTIVILYSIMSIIILLIFMLFDRKRRGKVERVTSDLKAKYQAALLDYLSNDFNSEQFKEQIKEIAESSFTRKVLINEMIDLSINMPNEISERLRELYFELGLNEDSLAKLQKRSWHTKIKGFKECAFMNIQNSKPFIEKNLHNKNEIVRSEAQLAMVRLSTEDPYAFLDNLKRPFSVWEQNIVHQEIISHNLTIPKFERWTTSENVSVRKFSTKMIQVFDQKRSWGKLVELLKDENEKIKASAIDSLGSLNVKKSQSHLKEQYQHEGDDNKLLILNALGKFKDKRNLVFFKHTLEEEEHNVWLQVEAAKGIKEFGETGKKELNDLLNSEEYRSYQIIIKHVLDERL